MFLKISLNVSVLVPLSLTSFIYLYSKKIDTVMSSIIFIRSLLHFKYTFLSYNEKKKNQYVNNYV